MAYHDLSSCTLTADERRAEADKIIKMLDNGGVFDQLTQREADFIDGIDNASSQISVKQLFWLRDIKDKYL